MATPAGCLARISAPWLFLVLAFLVSSVGNTLYWLIQTTPSDLFETLCAVMPGAAIWYWFWRYLREHRLAVPFDIGFFLGVAPFVVIPVYVFRAERWRGLLPLAGLAAVYVGAHVFVWVLFHVAAALGR